MEKKRDRWEMEEGRGREREKPTNRERERQRERDRVRRVHTPVCHKHPLNKLLICQCQLILCVCVYACVRVCIDVGWVMMLAVKSRYCAVCLQHGGGWVNTHTA